MRTGKAFRYGAKRKSMYSGELKKKCGEIRNVCKSECEISCVGPRTTIMSEFWSIRAERRRVTKSSNREKRKNHTIFRTLTYLSDHMRPHDRRRDMTLYLRLAGSIVFCELEYLCRRRLWDDSSGKKTEPRRDPPRGWDSTPLLLLQIQKPRGRPTFILPPALGSSRTPCGSSRLAD